MRAYIKRRLSEPELLDLVAQSIRGDLPNDTHWSVLMGERKTPWLEDARRVLATVKDYLTVEWCEGCESYRSESCERIKCEFSSDTGANRNG